MLLEHRRRLLVALLLALEAGMLLAQLGEGNISGRVTDSSTAAIPNAAIKLINESSGESQSTISSAGGLYVFTSLGPGSYRIEAEASGFQKTLRRGMVLSVGQKLAVDLTMQVGNITQTLEVTGAAPLLESQSSSLGQNIEHQSVEDMPLNGRRATDLVALSPATLFISGGGGESLPIFSTGGSRARNQQFLLDGGNATNAVGLAVPQQQLAMPVESMQEFTLLTNNYSAEYGHSAGGEILLSTRSGSNQFHGGLYEYFRNDALDARNFFSSTKAPIHWNVFGAYVSGPIRKDKTHFFLSWEGTRQNVGSTKLLTVPTVLQRHGDFSQTRGANGAVVPIYDPETTRSSPNGTGTSRDAFPGNMIPANRFDPVAAGTLGFWPLPNLPGSITGANNFTANNSTNLTRNIMVFRLDHRLTEKDMLMYRQYLNANLTAVTGVYANAAADPFQSGTDIRTQNFLVSETHTFSPSLINDFRFDFLPRWYLLSSPGLDQNPAKTIGLQGVGPRAFPQFSISGFQGLGRSGPYRSSSPIDDQQVQDSFTWVRGQHILKFGGEYRWGAFGDDTNTNPSGLFAFNQLMTALPGVNNTGNSFGSFLLGQVNNASILQEAHLLSHAGYNALYVQDDWRVGRRLTLNLGLRWESEIPRSVEENKLSSFDPLAINPVSGTRGVVTFAGQNGVPNTAWDRDWNNFGPRLGFAWSLGHTVIRGGGGIFYASAVSNIVANVAALGFSIDSSITSPQAGIVPAFALANGYPPFTPPGASRLNPSFGAVPSGQTPTTAVAYFERNRPTPYSQQFNLDIQHEIANMVFDIGYIGNVSHRLTGNDFSLNQVPPQLLGPGNGQSRRPFSQFSNVRIINPPIGNSTYHAGFVRVQRRFTNGLSFLAHYTYSKFIDDMQSFNDLGATGIPDTSYSNAYNRAADKALSGNDIRHRAILSGVYEIPYGAGRKFGSRGFAGALFGGWNLSVIAAFQTGTPSTVIAPDTTNAFPAGPLRADLIGDPAAGGGSISRWFNTAAFRQPAPNTFGTAGRNIVTDPGTQTIDTSVMKFFSPSERIRIEFRGDFFNVFNRANFNPPGPTLNTANFGVISSAKDPRQIQFGLKATF